jgi:hypothetical protein
VNGREEKRGMKEKTLAKERASFYFICVPR